MTMDEWTTKQKEESGIEHLRPEDVEVMNPGDSNVTSETSDEGHVQTMDPKFGTLALILGILSIVFGIFFAGAPWIGILLGIAAIILGVSERKHNNPASKGSATGGLVCGIVGLVFSVVFGVICAVLGTIFRILFSCIG